eukprot:GSChrysophyteH1.ASY1.ANO1.797.1 assembled CDS
MEEQAEGGPQKPPEISQDSWDALPVEIRQELVAQSVGQSIRETLKRGPPHSGVPSPKKQARLYFGSGKVDGDTLFRDEQFPPDATSIDGYKYDENIPKLPPPNCKCEGSVRAALKVSTKHGPNLGRHFYSCAQSSTGVSKRSFGCGYFLWAPPGSVHQTPLAQVASWQPFNALNGFRMFCGSFRPQAIQQGGLGDCWFLSALAVLSERRDLIERICVTKPNIPHKSALKVCLFIDGLWRRYEIDSFLPTYSTPNTQTSASAAPPLLYSRCDGQSHMWVPFVEKAYAKAHHGYHSIHGGEIHEALFDLTGAPVEVIDFNHRHFNSEEVWLKLLSFRQAGFPMGAATNASGEGIVGFHAYSLLDVPNECDIFSDGGSLRVLKVRNPWGKRGFTGDLSKNSELNASLRSLYGGEKLDNGTFLITYHDFLKRFAQIDVCKAHQTATLNFDEASMGSFTSKTRVIFSVPNGSMIWTFLTIIQPTKRGKRKLESSSGASSDQYYFYEPLSLVVRRLDSDGTAEMVGASLCGPQRTSLPLELHLASGNYEACFMRLGKPNSKLKHGKSVHSCTLRAYSSRPLHLRTQQHLEQHAGKNGFDPERSVLRLLASEISSGMNGAISNCTLMSYVRMEQSLDSKVESPSRQVVDLTTDDSASASPAQHAQHSVELRVLSGHHGLKMLIMANFSSHVCKAAGLLLTANYVVQSEFIVSVSQQYEGDSSGGTSSGIFSTRASGSDTQDRQYTMHQLQTALPPHTIRILAVLTRAVTGRESGVSIKKFAGSPILWDRPAEAVRNSKSVRVGAVHFSFEPWCLSMSSAPRNAHSAKELPELFKCQSLSVS